MHTTPSLQWHAIGSLSGHGVWVLAFTVVIFAVFVWDRFELGSAGLAVLTVSPALSFVYPQADVPPHRFLAGFGHPVRLTTCALMVLGHALVLTGALGPAA